MFSYPSEKRVKSMKSNFVNFAGKTKKLFFDNDAPNRLRKLPQMCLFWQTSLNLNARASKSTTRFRAAPCSDYLRPKN